VKRFVTVILALVMALSLCACGGGGGANDITIGNLCGDWVREDNGWIMTITEDEVTERSSMSSTSRGSHFGIEDGVFDGKYKIITEGGKVVKLEGETYSYVPFSPVEVAMGETFKDNGIAEVTITDIEYGTSVSDDGMVSMILYYTVKNTYKRELKIPGGVQFTINYADGYQFGTEEGRTCFFREEEGSGFCMRESRDGVGSSQGSFYLAPLSEKTYSVDIPVAEVLSTDTESSLSIDITLVSDDSFAYGNVKIR